MTERAFDYSEFVHSPAQLATEYVNWAKRIHETPGVPFGVSVIDKSMIPMHPGDLGAIVARPGHGKTSLLAYLARAEARRIVARGMADRECVVYVTWEQVAEELENIFEQNDEYTPSDVAWGRADIDKVIRHSFDRPKLPVWIIGHSLARAHIKMPHMTTDVVFQAIERIETDYHRKPTLICMDYVQIIPTNRQKERVMQVIDAVIGAKELMMRVGSPGWIGAQARREVDDRDEKIPKPRDAQWGSVIEQTVDKYMGVWRPWLTEKRDATIKINGVQVPVTKELLVIEMSKQRFEQAGFIWPLHFAPQYLELCEYELRRQEESSYDF